jgi:hypothetical protein
VDPERASWVERASVVELDAPVATLGRERRWPDE